MYSFVKLLIVVVYEYLCRFVTKHITFTYEAHRRIACLAVLTTKTVPHLLLEPHRISIFSIRDMLTNVLNT